MSNSSSLNLITFNCHGLASTDKIIQIKKYATSKKCQVILLQEAMVSTLTDEFFDIFPSARYYTRHSSAGQGLVSIVDSINFPNGASIEIKDRSTDTTLIHFVNLKFQSECITIANIYHGPRFESFDECFLALLVEEVDICCGDFNCYHNRTNLERYRQFNNLIESDFMLLSNSNTFPASSATDAGPDHCLLNNTSLLQVSDAAIGTLQSDHNSLLLNVVIDWFDYQPESSASFKEITIFDYSLISSAFMDSEYEALKSDSAFLENYYKLWESWLEKCRKTIQISGDRPGPSIVDSLAAVSSSAEYDKTLGDWLCEADNVNNLATTFKVLKHLTNVRESKETCNLDFTKKISRTSELKSWDNFKNLAEKPRKLSQAKMVQYKRAVKWYTRILGRKSSLEFSMFELKSAMQKIKKSCVGCDRVPFKFFPRSNEHLKNFLKAINTEIFSQKPLIQQLKSARAQFITKPHDPFKLRSIQMVNRLSALVETLLTNRLMNVVLNSNKFDNRHGFIKSRSTDHVVARLVNKLWENKEAGLKTAVVSLDQSKAYDTVNHKLLIIKLKRLIQAHGDYDKYAIIVGFTDLWLDGRSTRWGNFKAAVRVGVPQGSPYSCLLYVVFFDYSAPEAFVVLALYYADDVHFVVEGVTWKEVEGKINNLVISFDLWCEQEGQIINKSKSTCCFIGRKSTNYRVDFELNEAITNEFRCLGVVFQSNFTFTSHVQNLQRWLKVRTSVIKILQFRLSISTDVLIRVAQTYRAKLVYGTYWILTLSKSLFSALSSSLNMLYRAVGGFTKLVPASIVNSYIGLDPLEIYFNYWIISRSVDCHVTGQFDLFGLFIHAIQPENNQLPDSPRYSYRFRSKTIAAQANNTTSPQDIFPDRASDWFDDNVAYRKMALDLFDKNLKGYKIVLKRNLLARVLPKGTWSLEEVTKLNAEYYERFCGNETGIG